MLKILPSFTDGAIDFIDNIITERLSLNGSVNIFEFGCGNSTLYFLSRECNVRSIDHDRSRVDKINSTAKILNLSDRLDLTVEEKPYQKVYTNKRYDIVIIGGDDRLDCLNQVVNYGLNDDLILVFENSERTDYLYQELPRLMSNPSRDLVHFEQPQVEKANLRLTMKSYDRNRADHRWITSISFLKGAYTTQGKLFSRPKAFNSLSRKYVALNDLDKKLEKYLNHSNGFFIEAGANDGLKQSNSYYFAKSLQWKGILVEAIPELFEKCVKNRPESKVYHYALVGDDSVKSVNMHFADLMSTVEGALNENQSEHIQKAIKIQNLPGTWEVKVPASTLTALLKQYCDDNHQKSLAIDLLSLDVEGFEINVLKGLDMNVFRPRFMLIECRNIEEIDSYLLQQGYCQMEKLSHHDYLFADERIS